MELQFGKFKGLSISAPEVTTKYLEWLLERLVADTDEIQAELARRQQAEAGNLTLAGRMVVAGFRALAKEHRDDPDIMRELTGARAALEEVLDKYFEEGAKTEETRQMNQTRDVRDARNRAYAMKLLKDKHAEPDDVAWAREILGSH
jgi:hypothetical protein